ncbi:MAG: glycosyl transferase [Paenibacillus sp.]|nr:glycosyl transferase [Paenibacillus sp.]
MNIAGKLHKIAQLEDQAFVAEAYRRILDREADEEGMAYHIRQLRKGTPKHRILITLLQTDEALGLFAHSAPPGQAPKSENVCTAIRRIFAMKHEPFVHSLYREVLCREPDQPAYAGYVDSLNRGTPKSALFKRFVSSGEFESLLGLDKYPFAKRVLDQLIIGFYK